jgi:hypothetical protein
MEVEGGEGRYCSRSIVFLISNSIFFFGEKVSSKTKTFKGLCDQETKSVVEVALVEDGITFSAETFEFRGELTGAGRVRERMARGVELASLFWLRWSRDSL